MYVDIFTKIADMQPIKYKEAGTCNKAIDNIFERLGVPESINCDESSQFVCLSFKGLLGENCLS